MSWDNDTEYTSALTLERPELDKILLKTLFFKEDDMLGDPYFDTNFLENSKSIFKKSIGGAYFDPKFSMFLSNLLLEDLRNGVIHEYNDDWCQEKSLEYYGEEIDKEGTQDFFASRCSICGPIFDLDSNDMFSLLCHLSKEKRGFIYGKHIEGNMGGEPWDIWARKYSSASLQWYYLAPECRKFSKKMKDCGAIKSENIDLYDIHSDSICIPQSKIADMSNSIANRLIISKSDESYFVIPLEDVGDGDEYFKWLCGNYTRSEGRIPRLNDVQAPTGNTIFWPPKIWENGKLSNFPIRELAVSILSNKIEKGIHSERAINSDILAKIVEKAISDLESSSLLRLGMEVNVGEGSQIYSERSITIKNLELTLSEKTIPGEGSSDSSILKDGKICGRWEKINRSATSSTVFRRKYMNVRRHISKMV